MANFLLYGATGYTGALIARTAVAQGLQPIIAGRNAAKLKTQAEELGVEYRAFSLDNRAALTKTLADVTVVLNCAGPFAVTAGLLVKGCLQSGTHYLDIAGEVPEFEAMAGNNDPARQAGVMLLPGVGFGIVPTDCLAAHLKRRLPSASGLSLAFQAVGGVSQGTLNTIIKDLPSPGVVRRNGTLAPARPAWRSRQIDFGHGPVKTVANPWRGDIFTAFYSTSIANIETFTAFPAPLRGLMASGRYVGWLWNSAPVQELLKRLVAALPAGPTKKELAEGSTHIWGEVMDDAGQKAVARLHGPEAYIFTAQTSLAVVERVLAAEVQPGFKTPAQVYGPDFVLQVNGVTREDVL